MRWESVALIVALLGAVAPTAAAASTVAPPPNRLHDAVSVDLRETIDHAVGFKRPEGATYANARGEIVSPHAAGGSGIPRVHFTLLGSGEIARSINRRLRSLFEQRETPKTSVLTPTHQR